jgi:protein-S-isoprenylcysteine O-methyltransferase Ste14
MKPGSQAYGLWPLVLINSAVFIIFALSFWRLKNARDYRTFGAFAAFIVALFAEMYGFPLTIYLLTGWLGSRFPGADPFSHEGGHLWYTLLGLKGNPHLSPLHFLSNALIFGGFILTASAWKVLFEAQRRRALAVSGPYSLMRHPQYVGFMLVMLGFLVQWPTLLTIAMFPLLVAMYVRLARREEREVKLTLGEEYERYASRTPAFFPRIPRKKHGRGAWPV